MSLSLSLSFVVNRGCSSRSFVAVVGRLGRILHRNILFTEAALEA